MKLEWVVEAVLVVRQVKVTEHGIQEFECGDGYWLEIPPIEYTLKPGDELRVQWDDILPPGDAIWYLSINGGPVIDVSALWHQLIGRLSYR